MSCAIYEGIYTSINLRMAEILPKTPTNRPAAEKVTTMGTSSSRKEIKLIGGGLGYGVVGF